MFLNWGCSGGIAHCVLSQHHIHIPDPLTQPNTGPSDTTWLDTLPQHNTHWNLFHSWAHIPIPKHTLYCYHPHRIQHQTLSHIQTHAETSSITHHRRDLLPQQKHTSQLQPCPHLILFKPENKLKSTSRPLPYSLQQLNTHQSLFNIQTLNTHQAQYTDANTEYSTYAKHTLPSTVFSTDPFQS